jgi:uncharacterized damage-inducible protein DinB
MLVNVAWTISSTAPTAHLPSTTIGLLYHAAEHTVRHAGQVLTTAKILQGM